ncbi:MAG: hypothetical protein ABIP74_04935 [Candidatus Saccharimonas sp.]
MPIIGPEDKAARDTALVSNAKRSAAANKQAAKDKVAKQRTFNSDFDKEARALVDRLIAELRKNFREGREPIARGELYPRVSYTSWHGPYSISDKDESKESRLIVAYLKGLGIDKRLQKFVDKVDKDYVINVHENSNLTYTSDDDCYTVLRSVIVTLQHKES